MIKNHILITIAAVIPTTLILSSSGVVLASSHHSDTLKQILKELNLQTALTQDNANVQTTRLNTMSLALENMTAELQIIGHANTVSINGSAVK